MTARRSLAVAALAAAAAACGGERRAHADSAGQQPAAATLDTTRPAALTEADVQAVVDAVNAGDARLAALAAPKAASPEVKRFAGRLGSAHRQKVTDAPAPTTGAAGDALAAPLRAFQADAESRLAALPAGPAFDRAFVEVQADAHARALAVLDRVAPAARVGDLPSLVARTRSEVQQHLDEARALQGRLP